MMMIRNYGLFWKSKWVDWGAPGPGMAGELLGTTRHRYAANVDFRDQVCIYALYSKFDLVYVGQTGTGDQRLLQRLRIHRSDHLEDRWNRFSWFGMRGVLQLGVLAADAGNVALMKRGEALNIMEALAIAISEPPLNRQGGPWGEAATQYFQVRPGPNGQPG